MNRNFSIDAILARKPVEKRKQIITKDNCKFIRVFLQSSNLWRRFHNLGTEMIVTKSGRRMFPTLSVIIAGLDPVKSYVVMVDLECIEMKRFRYSFHQSKWISTGPGESELPSRMFVHTDSPARGAHWMRAPVSFDKMKLTNNQLDNNGHIIVNSMHKYRPRVHIIEQDDSQKRHTFSFEETEFIAVTAYQNHRITSLKIESNPFAKGFRECEVQGIEMNSVGGMTGGPAFQSVFPLIFPYFANLASNMNVNK
ncbi:T-box transcription factor mls-1 [Caenorhabditis elegans]|uniref:T-box transcription factor mls-1 n=1 Tax=Caenorhabditis elegans TaxID=6239 RepID=TBX1_CAEEL|nr:T-box transcription factor mls-1 [Caenorhabditis elegans]O17212.1 RecName: Full=T-box transcription factor mls-1; AltName: Full=Mesodermal lineage specification protein 1 [Caenorhabditis elegans]CCD72344.1 T-box transcription factor mls-1 [Caenorhabditis elegans]|eukprot:NP_498640.1 T-box transcription factor mls-1 [Caenorhabditis elegans]